VSKPRIFLNYRREDTRGYAGRLYDRLSHRFGEEQIFRDIDAIPPGLDYAEEIDRLVSQCDLMLVLIGESWLSVHGAGGRRRLEEPGDLVSLEIAAGLERKIPVIPVLIQGARMPDEEELPDRIQALARRNALEMSDSHWNHDWERLTWAIDELTKRPPPRDHSAGPGGRPSSEGASDLTEPLAGPLAQEPAAVPSSTTRPMGRLSTVALAVVPLIVLIAAAFLAVRVTGNRSDRDAGQRGPATPASTAASVNATSTTAHNKERSSATAKAAYPNAAERQLLSHIPPGMRKDCDRAARPVTGASVAIRCTENNAPSVQYNLYHTNDAMYHVFNSRANVVGAHPGSCNTTAVESHLDKALHDGKPVGRLLCYTYRGEARLEWTNELLKVYTYVFSKSQTAHELYHTVYQHAGPHSHQMAD
jgi:TIR domain-containing protein